MHRLKKGVRDRLSTESGKKRGSRLYLFRWQWDILDAIAEENGKSRNQIARELLYDYFNGKRSASVIRRELATSALERIYQNSSSEQVRNAVETVEQELQGGRTNDQP